MVGGLVEEEHVGGLEEQTAQGHPPAFTAGEPGHIRIPRRQPQGIHGHFDRVVQLPGVGGLDPVLDPRLLVHDLGHLRVRKGVPQLHGQLLETIEEGPDRSHRLLHVLEDALPGVQLRLLGEVPDARALRGEGLSREVPVEPGHYPQKRALAGAVRPQDPDLGVRIEREPDPAQDLFSLGRDLAQVLHGENVLGGHKWGRLCHGRRSAGNPRAQ